MKILHFGSYWQKENDIVYAMAKDLSEGYDAILIDTHLYDNKRSDFIESDFDNPKDIRWISTKYVQELIYDNLIDVVIVNAGGISLKLDYINSLKKTGVKTIGISLSDPDVYEYNGKIYSQHYDFYYTNSIKSINTQYINNSNIDLLPFAASKRIHYPINANKVHDVVIVGSYRTDRIEIIKELKKHFNIGIYGDGWKEKGISSYGNVNGKDHIAAIGSGKIYLSFSGTAAGYENVKVGLFEAVACKTCVVTHEFEELNNYFKRDEEIVTYTNIRDLIEKIKFLLADEKKIIDIAENSYNRFLKEHTWEIRWKKVISKIE